MWPNLDLDLAHKGTTSTIKIIKRISLDIVGQVRLLVSNRIVSQLWRLRTIRSSEDQ